MRLNELVIYRPSQDEYILNDITSVIDNYEVYEDINYLRDLFYEGMSGLFEQAGNHGFYGNLWHCYLTNLLVNNDNPYSRATEIKGHIEGTINQAVLHDIEIIRELFEYDFSNLLDALEISGFELIENYVASTEESKVYNNRIKERICNLAVKLHEADSAEMMKDVLTTFYGEFGVGKFGLHKAFRVEEDEKGKAVITPILNITHVKLDDLVGYENCKAQLTGNTEAFIKGKKANNCLLYGDAGTGKSTSIKAITNTYFDQGLRVIEIYKHQFKLLNDVISQIKNRNYKFIIYMDDLSFEDFEIEYKYLKAVIEGGLEKKPSNVLIYATSNKRHLVNETFSEREDNLHASESVQEKLSLYARFGVTIYYSAPEKKEFQKIVKELADREQIGLSDDELMAEANKWEMTHGGYSGRTARQLIDYLIGKQA